ncbi:MAG: ROK family protein [Bacteroidota bacterium]
MEYYIGIDIGGTSTKLGLISRHGEILGEDHFDSGMIRSEEEFMKLLDNRVKSLLCENGIGFSDVRGIGIGAPTGNYNSGKIENPVNLNLSNPLEVTHQVEKMWGLPAFLTNDANMAALGELKFGKGRYYNHLLVVTLGTGVGGGIIENGRLIHGMNDLAGEIGHMTLVPNGRICSCGKRGCLETYVSIRGIKETYRSLKPNFPVLEPFEMAAEASEKNEMAMETIQRTGYYLGLGLSNAATALAPECIVLSGGLSNLGKPLLEATLRAFNQNILPLHKNKIELEISELKGNTTAMLGAVVLVNQNTSDTLFIND